MAKGVAVELLVDVYVVAVERGVDRVAPPAEVDEIQELEMFLQLVLGDGEALDDLVRGNDGLVVLAAGREEVGEEGLQNGEALRDDWARRALACAVVPAWRCSGRELRRCGFVLLADDAERLRNLAAELVRFDRDGAAILAQDPRSELRER
jgi:hypothetical protein